MIEAAIVGLGWWGSVLVESAQGSDAIRFVAAYTRSRSERDRMQAKRLGLTLVESLQVLLDDPTIDALVLATPPLEHPQQIQAAAAAHKHIFCEKPLALDATAARAALLAVQRAGVTIGLGYNRRFHPSWIDLKHRIDNGELGVILHAECTMSSPNALSMAHEAWRASRSEAPCGGLAPMGVHAIDGLIDLFGDIDRVYCHSACRAAPSGNDDATSILLRLKAGMSAYVGTLMSSAPEFRFQVFGSKASAMLGGQVHVAGQSAQERRSGLFGSYTIRPLTGDPLRLDVPTFDVNRAELEAFARAADGFEPYPITPAQMLHGVAVTEAIILSARAGGVAAVEEHH
jgi:predicted dehydrogenase